jgi:hypothetical protein
MLVNSLFDKINLIIKKNNYFVLPMYNFEKHKKLVVNDKVISGQ